MRLLRQGDERARRAFRLASWWLSHDGQRTCFRLKVASTHDFLKPERSCLLENTRTGESIEYIDIFRSDEEFYCVRRSSERVEEAR